METGDVQIITGILLFIACVWPSLCQNWQWQCSDNGNCIRVHADKAGSSVYLTVAECRFFCNKYSNLWPRPTGKISFSHKAVAVDVSQLSVDTVGVVGIAEKAFIQQAAQILSDTLHSDCPSKESTPIRVKVFTKKLGLHADWNTDESYTVQIISSCRNRTDCNSKMSIEIHAVTVYGARHGLESLGQLTICRASNKTSQLFMMSNAHISDKPAYPHRGLLIDTSRTFLKIGTIKRTIKAMSWSKMNILHWHISDSHSFPFKSSRVPKLTEHGAYSNNEIYSEEDVKDIIEFARLRGIRILVEIDAPAHAGNGWNWDNQTLCVNAQPWRKNCIQPPCGQLNPMNEQLYSTLALLYQDIWETFKPWVFHMGGDEVFLPCWKDLIKTADFKQKDQPPDLLLLWKYFQDRALQVWDQVASSTQILLWTSELTKPDWISLFLNSTRYVIQTWTETSDPTPMKLLEKGYKLVFSTKDVWYLDHGFDGHYTYHKWNTIYDYKIPPASHGVYGGEACMWGELVGDSNIDVKVWPRASCVAERLWSNPDESSDEAVPRLQNHLETLIRRGVNADRIQPEWCSQNDGLCQ